MSSTENTCNNCKKNFGKLECERYGSFPFVITKDNEWAVKEDN